MSPAVCACGHGWPAHRQRIGSCTSCACAPTCSRCGAGWREPCSTPTGRRHAEHPRVAARAARRVVREAEFEAWCEARRRERARDDELLNASRARTAGTEAFLRAHLAHGETAGALRELGLEHGATVEAIKAAFRRRALAAHPDHGGDGEAFKALVRARDRALAGAAP